MNKFEEIIENVLKMLDEGRSEKEILSAYPLFQKEISEMFFIINGIEKMKEDIVPSQKLTKRIMKKINPSPIFSIFQFRFIIPASATILAIALLILYAEKQKSSSVAFHPEEIRISPIIEIVPKSEKTAIPKIVKSTSDVKNIAVTEPPLDTAAIDAVMNELLATLVEEQSIQNEETNDLFFNESDLPQNDFNQLFNDNEI